MNPPAAGRQLLRPQLAMRAAVVQRLAAARGMAAWLVGGTVRDLLLSRDSPDLDFVVEADALALAALAADIQRELGGRLVRHPAFLTADVIDGAGVHLDIAGARRETYPEMAALPEVRPAGIEDDLRRRDFTVNAMAMPLGPLAGGAGVEPLDPCGGRRDLEARALAVLHERSFLDDPTRVLRGVRFEARLGFRFTAATEELTRRAVVAGAFARLSGSRLRREMELLLGAEPLPAMALAGLARLADLGVLPAIHPRLAFDDAARRRVQEAGLEWAWHQGTIPLKLPPPPRAPEPPVRPWLLLLMALLGGLDAEASLEAARRLALAGEELRLAAAPAATSSGGLAALAARLRGTARPSEVDAALAPLGGEELLLLAAVGGAQVRAWVRRYWLEMRPLAAAVGGADLVAAGASRGPAIGRALRAARAARLDGEIAPGEELGFALAHLGGDHARNIGGRGGEGGAGER